MNKDIPERRKIEIVPDELCEHVEMGAPIVGGFLFTGEPEPISVAMCQDCLDWCHAEFENPAKLEVGAMK